MRTEPPILVALALVACSDDPPFCAERREGSFSVDSHGESLVDAPLVVSASSRDELRFAAELPCDPADGTVLSLGFYDLPVDAWLPPRRAEVVATATQDPEGWAGGYALLRSPDGLLLWEGGSAQIDPATTPRFRVVNVPEAEACSDKPDPCVAEAPIRAAVRTDEGEVQLASGEHRVVTVDGEPYVAVVRATRLEFVGGCNVTDTVEGPRAAGYLVRTLPADLPLAPECE